MLEQIKGYQAKLLQQGAEASEAGDWNAARRAGWPWILVLVGACVGFCVADRFVQLTGALRYALGALILLPPFLGMFYAMSACTLGYIRAGRARHQAALQTRRGGEDGSR